MKGFFQTLKNVNLAAFKPQSLKQSFNAWLYAPTAKPSAARDAQMMRWDKPLLFVSLALMLLGIIMVYSASIALPDSPKYASYWGEHFFGRQIFFVVAGLCAGWMAFRVHVDKWQKWSWWFFVGAMVLLVLVLVPGVGKGVNGAHRWISLKVFNIQPSEIMKLAMVLFAANFTVRNQQYMHRLTKGFFPIAFFLIIVGLLLMLEPDMGAMGVVFCIAMGILFLGGFNRIWFSGMVGVLGSLFTMLIVFSPWRRARF
ncbi:MAG: FtsW/RodA/SpoVE family cell cycle protein, partial [Oxalobacter sp.]|nr:FtsW/RodA/SpoVE family cell cycle protein [Oxalobacter sp.]